MIKNFRLAFIIIAYLSMVCIEAQAVITPKPISTDKRLRTIVYNPNEIFVYRGFYGYQSSIIFAPGENVETITMGDSTSWQILPTGNRLFIKPIEGDAETNMLIITNKREYQFILEAAQAIDINDPDLVFSVTFIYPGDSLGDDLRTFNNISTDSAASDSTNNFNYSVSGPDFMAPLKIFDDGEFTYFEFRDINGTLPAMYSVDKNGLESMVNYKVQGKYVIVEAVYPKMTLRSGDEAVCVYNDSYAADMEKAKKLAVSEDSDH